MTELCFNIWYYIDKDQNIIAISAREYMLGGDDDSKASILKQLSMFDYKTVDAVQLPASLQKQFSGGVNYSIIRQIGVEEVFKELFEGIRHSTADGISFPEDKLFFATPLFDLGNGFIPIEIGDGYIRERDMPG